MSGRAPRLAVLTAVVCLLAPLPAGAWGLAAHRAIADAVIALLPDELRPMFEAHRTAFVERSIDPDTWRIAGFDAEDKHHYLNLDWTGFGPEPFLALPRNYEAAVARFGLARLEETGILPWRVEAFAAELHGAFERMAGGNAFATQDAILFSAWLAHYVSDAHVPFHAVVNYDGQLTGQRGIHARFETQRFERYRDQLVVASCPMAPISDPPRLRLRRADRRHAARV